MPPNRPSNTIAGLVASIMFGAVSTASGQQVLGGLRGTVTQSADAPAAGAQVFLLGTAFRAVADEQGRYTIDHIPAGDYTVQATLPASAPGEASVRVRAGTTTRLDLSLGRTAPAPGTLSALRIVSDAMSSGATFPGELLDALPVDEARQTLTLMPGVVARGTDVGIGSATGHSIRGGAPGEASVYVDGAPVRFETLGIQGLAVGTNALAELSVTTGVPTALTSDGRGGVIGYVTRSGGREFSARVRADTDEPFGDGSSVGYNRFEGAAGGPSPGMQRVRWFLSAAVLGQRSRYRGPGAADQPTYVVGGADTTVTWIDFGGQSFSATLPLFVQSSGRCDADQNLGFACGGLRRPLDWSTQRMGQGKLLFSYGDGSSVSLTGVASDQQQRFFPGAQIADAALYQGARAWSRLIVLNWSQILRPSGDGAVAVNANLSYGTDRRISGPLDPASDVATRDPFLGIEFAALRFTAQDSLPFPLSDRFIRNIRTNSGLRVPFLDRTDLRNAQPYRLNPFGFMSGWPTQGIDSRLAMTWERRVNGRVFLDWQASDVHRITLGGDVTRTDLSHYDGALLRTTGLDAFLVHPRRFALFAGDRVELGDFSVDIGVRYDRFTKGGEFPNAPGRIFTDPAWGTGADTSDTAYVGSLARVFDHTGVQGALSPRVRLAYAIAPRTSVRLGYGQVVEPPRFGLLFAHSNSDLGFTSAIDLFGWDLTYRKSTLWEAGIRHGLTSDVTMEVAVYDKTFAGYEGRIMAFDDPAVPGSTVNINALTAVDAGHRIGVDARVDWHQGEFLAGALAYSFLRSSEDANNAAHAVAGLAMLRVPADWKPQTVLGTVARDVTASMTVRVVNGLPYTRLQNSGAGIIAPDVDGGIPIEPRNSSRLPWTKSLDLTLSKGFLVGRVGGIMYADLRNLFGFTNILGAYAETGAVENGVYEQALASPELVGLQNEASSNNALLPDGTVDLNACATWFLPVNCVALQRVERRFGDGDGLYSTTEQVQAFNAYYDSFFGPWRFYGPARAVRIGIQLRF
ncbi:MAG: TonB-dependent receptor domain-containing protein [Gemmatimonadales bacterium]